MTHIGLLTLHRQAARAALQGDALAFAVLRANIETLDRLGEIPREHLDLLHITASARLGDTERALEILRRFGALSSAQQRELFDGLQACPEMAHERFREFVRQLRVASRTPGAGSNLLGLRALCIFLGSLTFLLSVALLLINMFVLPESAQVNTNNLLTSVADANPRLLLRSLPKSWRASLEEAALRLASSPVDEQADPEALKKSLGNLESALLRARNCPQAKNISAILVGDGDDLDALTRLAAGIADLSRCAWMNPRSWTERPPWDENFSANALLVWRTVLAHSPLSQWSDKLFSTNQVIAPPRSSVFFTSENATQPDATHVQVQCGDISWQLTCVQVEGVWVPADWVNDWSKAQPWINGTMSPAFPLSQLETQLARNIDAVASWLTEMANSTVEPSPSMKGIPWWSPR